MVTSIHVVLASLVGGAVAEGGGLVFTPSGQVRHEVYRMPMSETVENIIEEAVQLPPDQRLTIAYKILSSVEPEASEETDTAWDREIRDRIARFDAGGVSSIPASEVFGELFES